MSAGAWGEAHHAGVGCITCAPDNRAPLAPPSTDLPSDPPRPLHCRISNFILYRIAATLYLVVFFFVAVFAIKPSSYDPSYPAYFSLPVLMLLLITGEGWGVGCCGVVWSRTQAAQPTRPHAF